jgi:hypothetical protein
VPVRAHPAADEIYTKPTFPTWRYAPSYFPEGFAIEVAEGTAIAEPEIFYLPTHRVAATFGQQPLDHAIPAMALHSVTISGPVPRDLSVASRAAMASGTVQFEDASSYTLTLDFRRAPDTKADLRPELPLILRW